MYTPAIDHEAIQEAHRRGVEAAKAAASWVTDGNESDESRRRKLAMMDEGDPQVWDYLPREPNLSGEFADDPTPASLAADILGQPADELYPLDEAVAVVDLLADAFEEGVDETFQAECEAELHRWVR